MASAARDLELFQQFVQRRMDAGDCEASLDELFDLWRHEHPSPELYAENVAVIAASIEDFRRGERGTVAGQHSAELRQRELLHEKAETVEDLRAGLASIERGEGTPLSEAAGGLRTKYGIPEDA